MRERTVEKYLIDQIEAHHGMALKFTSGTNGVPDRIVVINDHTIFVELKRPGEKPKKHQLIKHAQLRRAGATVYVIDTKDGVDDLIQTYASTPEHSNT